MTHTQYCKIIAKLLLNFSFIIEFMLSGETLILVSLHWEENVWISFKEFTYFLKENVCFFKKRDLFKKL